MSYRKFYMTNGNGQTVHFSNHSSSIFLNNPSGLGFSQALTTTQYADRLVSEASQNFPSVSGEILFYDGTRADKYEEYNSFVDFLTCLPLTFYYEIPTVPALTFSLEVDVTSIEKTEVKTDGMMRCNFTLQGLSRWKGDTVTITGTGTTYTLTNNGQMPCGFEITLEGSMENPYFTLEQDGELYGEAKFDSSSAFSSVYVNSNDGEQDIVLERGGSVLPNPLSYQDLSISNGAIYVTFIKLAKGESTLTIGFDSGSLSNVNIVFVPLFRSV